MGTYTYWGVDGNKEKSFKIFLGLIIGFNTVQWKMSQIEAYTMVVLMPRFYGSIGVVELSKSQGLVCALGHSVLRFFAEPSTQLRFALEPSCRRDDIQATQLWR